MFRSLYRFAGLFMAIASVVAFSACGEEKSAACLTSARVGTSSPSEYYLQLTVCGYVVPVEGSVTFSARVWDGDGNPASGVAVAMAGPVATPVEVITGSNGYAVFSLFVEDILGNFTMTATLEDLRVAVSYVVVPEI